MALHADYKARGACPGWKADLRHDLAAVLADMPEPARLRRLMPLHADNEHRTGSHSPEPAPPLTVLPEFDAVQPTPAMWPIIRDSLEHGDDLPSEGVRVCLMRADPRTAIKPTLLDPSAGGGGVGYLRPDDARFQTEAYLDGARVLCASLAEDYPAGCGPDDDDDDDTPRPDPTAWGADPRFPIPPRLAFMDATGPAAPVAPKSVNEARLRPNFASPRG